MPNHEKQYIVCKKLVGIDAVVSTICSFQNWQKVGLKMPIQAPFGGSGEIFDP